MAKASTNNYTYPAGKKITTISANKVVTPEIDVDSLTLGGMTATDITTDKDSSDARALVTGMALHSTKRELTSQIQAIDPHNVLFQDHSAITLPIVDSGFDTEDWEWTDWEIQKGVSATFTAKGSYKDILNNIHLKSYPFTRIGTYFIAVDVSILDSGYLAVYDESDTELARVSVPGMWRFVYTPTTPDTASLKFAARDTLKNELISIGSIGVYYLTDRLEQYMRYIVPQVSSGSAYATTQYVDQQVNGIQLELEDRLANLPTFANLSILSSHVADHQSNPHSVTREQIGAASDDHTHTLEELGAAAVNHTHNPHDLQAAEAGHTHTLAELGAAAADHTHTLEELGAASSEHTHSLEELAAAPDVHSHPEYATHTEVSKTASDLRNECQIRSIAATYPLAAKIDGRLREIDGGYLAPIEVSLPTMITSQMVHMRPDTEDYLLGKVSTDTPATTPVWHAVYTPVSGDSTQYYCMYETDPTTHPVSLSYEFYDTYLSLDTYTLSIEHTTATKYPSAWIVYDGDYELDRQTDVVDWETDGYSKTFSITGSTPSKLRIVFTEVKDIPTVEDEDTPVETPVIWGVHLSMSRQDITDDSTITTVDYSVTYTSTIRHPSIEYIATPITAYADIADTTIHVPDPREVWYPIYVFGKAEIDSVYDVYTLSNCMSSLCPPEMGYARYGMHRQGIELFREYTPSTMHSMYGVLTTEDEVSNLESLYLKPIAGSYTIENGVFIFVIPPDVVKSTDSRTMTITHTGIPHLNLCGMSVYSNITDATRATHVKVIYTRVMEDYIGETVPERDVYYKTIVSGTIDSSSHTLTYKAVLVDTDIVTTGDSNKTWYVEDAIFDEMEIIENITELQYVFSTDDPSAAHVSVLGIQPRFTQYYFDISTAQWYDTGRDGRSSNVDGLVYLGGLKKLALQNGTSIWYPDYTPIGRNINIPLESTGSIKIENPFYTKHVSVSPIYGENMDAKLRVKNITANRISMDVESDIRGVCITRLW